MKYYKAFDRDLKCRGFQYQEGKTYETQETIKLCQNGFHFCKDLVLTLEYYPVQKNITENKYAEVEILGDVIWEDVIGHKGVTNKIRIVRVLSDKEVEKLVDQKQNSGDYNSGYGNSGDYNSGNGNSGDKNSGNYNSGNWNASSNESGFFNSRQDKFVRVFNKMISRDYWDNAYKPMFLGFNLLEDKSYKESFQAAWDQADPDDRIKIIDLPGFDAEVFYEISGIDLRDA